MRAYQKKQILDLLTTLHEATDEIHKQFVNRNIPAVINLLVDCQNAAVHIGEFIESIEGEDTRTVELLTEYHESLYQIAVKIETTDAGFVKQLKRELVTIESCIQDELKPNKIEVVLFPYKASMWDALESIWLAAKADPQCDVYVVPIPYFDRLPGGRLGQMQYEGHQYPDYVPVVDWQNYNLEERRPDVIFIHNPYDDGNIITTVHPNYYSRNLKKYTELLCYSPYFVTGNHIEEHFCTVSGIIHADRVFVQSEQIREGYIHAIDAFEKARNCVGLFGNVREKIVASGSPKFDKVINSKPDDFTLSDEWEKLIEKPDGSRKKVVLYNTSIGPLLRGNEKYIAKLRAVFRTVRNRDDVVLWWRPHPLSEAAYVTMRPFLLEEYSRLIEEYKLEGYGIYDDTADLHRALSLSSAFYGDASSLMPLYQCMKKPVVVQNEQPQDRLLVGGLWDTEEDLWFVTLELNGLFRLNKNARKVEYIGSFAQEKALDWRLYHTIHQSGNKLYFSPSSAGAIAIYDLIDSSFRYVELPLPKQKEYNDQSKFSKIIECDGSLYFIPLQFPGIVKLNLEDNSTEIIDEWIKPVKKLIFDSELGYFLNGVYDEPRGSLVLACFNASALIEIDLKTKKTKWKALSSDKCGYSDILLIDETYWLLALHKSALVSFNRAEETIAEYPINLEGIPADGFWQFQKLMYSNDSLYLVPADTQRLVKFELIDHSFSYVDDFRLASEQNDVPLSVSNPIGYFSVSSNTTDRIYLNDKQSRSFIEYDLINGSLRQESIVITDGDNLRDLQNFLIRAQGSGVDDANSCAFGEHTYGASLEALLDMITKPDHEPWLDKLLDRQVELLMSEISHPNGQAGIEIYDTAKRAVLKP